MSAETPGQAGGPFTMAEFDAEVRRRWIESSQRLGLDSGMPNAEAAIAAQQPQPAPELAAPVPRLRVDWARVSEAVADRERERDEARAELDRLRQLLAAYAAHLDDEALGNSPSKKSQILEDVARRIREALA